jgi:biopolymer transport protein ExbD
VETKKPIKIYKVFSTGYTMGNSISILINFETLKEMQKDGAIIIHTMDEDEKILIVGTIVAEKESEKINKMLSKNDYEKDIIIYGKNCHEYKKLIKKQEQLFSLGFKNVYIYLGGMFEWLLLQDVYGQKEFPSEKKGDILEFK